jgi:hypothetical protein
VDFELNPLALTELLFPSSYLLGLPGFTLSLSSDELALLISDDIEKRIGQALAFSDGVVTLDAPLFPAGTMFQAVQGGVVFATAATAVLTAVPEPGCLWLLCTGALVIVGANMRRRPGRPMADA